MHSKIEKTKNRVYIATSIIVFGTMMLILAMLFSITKGAANIPLDQVIEAILHFNKDNVKHLLVVDMRLPRVLCAAIVGSALAVAGAIMQGITRNPLADSGLMGLSSGASLALAICFVFIPKISYTGIIGMTFLGAAIGVLSVFGISSAVPGGNASMKLVLAGATISALFSALSQGLSIMNKVTTNVFFWTMGSVSGVSWRQIRIAAPIIVIALILSIMTSRKISIMNMGEEVAVGLGLNTKIVKIMATFLVVLLAGTSVAVAGMISFVGIVIPHLSRFLVGPDYRLIIPTSTVLGALLLVLADLFAKTYNPPSELPIGALIAVIGVPVFLYFARKQKGDK